jgi:hypothetical protein
VATVNFSVPEHVKKTFDKAFDGMNKSAIVAHLMRQAVDERRAAHMRLHRGSLESGPRHSGNRRTMTNSARVTAWSESNSSTFPSFRNELRTAVPWLPRGLTPLDAIGHSR